MKWSKSDGKAACLLAGLLTGWLAAPGCRAPPPAAGGQQKVKKNIKQNKEKRKTETNTQPDNQSNSKAKERGFLTWRVFLSN